MTQQPDQQKINKIATLAIKRLSRFATGGASISRSFLFNDNRLSGVRYRAGMFYADWKYGDAMVKFFRDGRQIDEQPVEEQFETLETKRAA